MSTNKNPKMWVDYNPIADDGKTELFEIMEYWNADPRTKFVLDIKGRELKDLTTLCVYGFAGSEINYSIDEIVFTLQDLKTLRRVIDRCITDIEKEKEDGT